MTDASSNSNALSSAYLNHPFIGSSKEEVTGVASQRDTIYQVLIDDARLANFAIEAQSSSALKNLTSCLGYEGSAADALVAEADSLPELYTEINDSQNFTRLYFTKEVMPKCYCPEGSQCDRACGNSEAKSTFTVDLKFSYPTNVNIPEPIEYKDYSAVMESLGKSLDGNEEVPPVEGPSN